jgi:hypothetical protein
MKSTKKEVFKRIQFFCVNKAGSSVFLFEKTNEKGISILQELMDLRLIHIVKSHETISKRIGHIYGAYMLDVSAYAERRKKKSFSEPKFWLKDTNLRRLDYILDEEFLFSNDPLVYGEEAKSEDIYNSDEAILPNDKQLKLKGFE